MTMHRKIALWLTGIISVLVLAGLLAVYYGPTIVFKLLVSSESQLAMEQVKGLENTDPAEDSAVEPVGETTEGSNREANAQDMQAPKADRETQVASKYPNLSEQKAPQQGSSNISNSARIDSQPNPRPVQKPPSEPTLTYDASITPEKAQEAQEQIAVQEKAKVTSILLKKLSASDLQLFAKMMGNGMSVEEKKEAKKIILQKLTEDEYNELIAIAAKLGLSQGKDYSSSVKDMTPKIEQ
jgi:hypothetical protein